MNKVCFSENTNQWPFIKASTFEKYKAGIKEKYIILCSKCVLKYILKMF